MTATWGTVTVLTFTDLAGKRAALHGLDRLIKATRDLTGLHDCWVIDTADTEAIMVTLYDSQESADTSGATMRPHLAATLGPHVTGRPHRRSGPVTTGTTDQTSAQP
jgi:hypothetical protein